MTRMVGSFAALLLAATGSALSATPASAQSAGQMETVMASNMTLPQTAWIKGEALGSSATEQKLRETVDLMLRQRGYVPEKFSPYAVRIEIRGLGVNPVEPAIPQYANAQPRLSIWNASTGPNAVTVSLILYHQSTGRTYWQAEGTCPAMDAAALSASMIVPLMEYFGQSKKAELGCTRAS